MLSCPFTSMPALKFSFLIWCLGQNDEFDFIGSCLLPFQLLDLADILILKAINSRLD